MNFHEKLEKLGIHHFCHYGNPWSVTDLSMASIMCTECRLERGEFTIQDLLDKTVNPLDVEYAFDRAVRLEKEEKQARIDGKKTWHKLYWPTIESKNHPKNGQTYERADCFEGRGSAAVEENRICCFCKKSVDI